MNNVVRPNFDIVFAEKSTCGSHEQCMGLTEKQRKCATQAQKRYLNSTFIAK